MNQLSDIKTLFETGNYSEASMLLDGLKFEMIDVGGVVSSIDEIISVVSNLEERINSYQNEVASLENPVSQIATQEQAVQIRRRNTESLCETIRDLSKLQLSDVQPILLEGDLDEKTLAALVKLSSVLEYQPASVRLRCLSEQQNHASNIKSRFCGRLCQIFSRLVNDLFSRFSDNLEPTLPSHDIVHENLMFMQPFIQWVKENDRSTYQELSDFYINRAKSVYDREIEIFFECAKENTIGSQDTQDTISAKGSEISYTVWDEYDAHVVRILQTVDPPCRSEQSFYTQFFCNEDSNDRLIMIFSLLEKEFTDFINFHHLQNGLCSLYLLVRLSQYLWSQDDPPAFLKQILCEVLIRVKRNFDNFMEQQLIAIRDLKPPKTSKCGVLSVVKNFEQFAKQEVSLFKSTGETARRTDIDRWYLELVTELFRVIDTIEHGKTPTEMIRLENYSYMDNLLRSIKVPCLKSQQEEANIQFKSALNAYVTRYFGRPLEKLNTFFEGVQARVAQGVKEEEVSFQLAFSKQELRKLLLSVTLKEVRKGLEEMYRRIEKHASEPDSNLIQVIWHAMQTEFLSQYKSIQGMIERCYPSSNLSLTFTIEDVLQVFKDIAQTH